MSSSPPLQLIPIEPDLSETFPPCLPPGRLFPLPLSTQGFGINMACVLSSTLAPTTSEQIVFIKYNKKRKKMCVQFKLYIVSHVWIAQLPQQK